MRFSKLAVASFSAVVLLSGCGPGYTTTRVGVTTQVGPGIDLYGYDATTYGDWRTGYRQWTPTVVYESNGQYYPTRIRGARQVQVYRTQSGYMLPPRDREWVKTDRRFKSKQMPNDADYGRARPRQRP